MIEEFVRKREGTERWFFRQVPDGPAFWVNHEQQKAVNRYPYLKELKKEIDDFKKNLVHNLEDAKRYLKSEWSLIKALFRKHPEPTARKMILDEARNFVEFFLKLKGENFGAGSAVEGKGYNLSNFLRKVGTQISKSDIMDLLFYCPFDFSQFISDDFLRSTESYLLKKIHQKNVSEALGDAFGELDDIRMRHDASFNSEGSNDSANKIRIKIEDSKKLLDLAANIKGLSLDPEKKREFMKLLIDFDQKYGDHDLVDALEKDLKTNISDEAALTQDLVDHIKQAIGGDLLKNEDPGSKNKNLNNLFSDNINDGKGSSGSAGVGVTGSKDDKNMAGLRKDSPDLLNQGIINSSSTENYNFEGGRSQTRNNDPSSALGSQLLQDISKIQQNTRNRNAAGDKLTSDIENINQSSSIRTSPQLKPAGTTENVSNNYDQQISGHLLKSSRDGRRSTTENPQNQMKKVGGSEGADAKEIAEGGSATEHKNKTKSKQPGKHQRTDSNDTLIEKWDAENGSYNNSQDAIDESGRDSQRVPGIKISQKLEYDENGKIIFTNRQTQEMLENLAEEQARQSSRSRSRNATGRRGSDAGSAEGDRIAPNEGEVVYQEIVLENGEKKLVPVILDQTKVHKNENQIVYKEIILENGEKKLVPVILNQNGITTRLHKDRSANHSPEHQSDPARNDTLPGVTGVPFHLPFSGQANSKFAADISFDPQVMRDSFNKYNSIGGQGQGQGQKNLLRPHGSHDLRKVINFFSTNIHHL